MTNWAALAGEAPAEAAELALRLATVGVDARAVRRVLESLLADDASTDAVAVLRALAVQARGVDDHEARRNALRLEELGARVLLPGHPGYPARLGDAWPELGAPAWLFALDFGWDQDAPAVAVVGTRRPTLDGLDVARALGRSLARSGIIVVSGLARGIDQAAHRGALDAGGVTVAVLGTGFDVDYPRGDTELRDAIAASGGLLTELVPGAPPRPHHFLARNRILSGLADVTVVVEGRARSGSLQTARLAGSQGRDVWAVPGSINAPTSRGPLDLIRDGAQVVTRLDDVVEAAGAAARRVTADRPAPAVRPPAPAAPAVRPPVLSPEAATVLDALGAVPATPGRIAAATRLPLPAVLAAVSELQAHGLAAAATRGVVRTPAP